MLLKSILRLTTISLFAFFSLAILANNHSDSALLPVSQNKIPVGPASQSIAITPNGKFAYVVGGGTVFTRDLNTGYVAVIDTATNQVIKTLDSDFDEPTDIAFTPNGQYAYITNCGKNSAISKLETATNQVVATIKLREYLCPKFLTIAPDGSKAYIVTSYDIEPMYDETTILILDAATNKIVTSIHRKGAKWITGVAIDNTGSKLYVAFLAMVLTFLQFFLMEKQFMQLTLKKNLYQYCH